MPRSSEEERGKSTASKQRNQGKPCQRRGVRASPLRRVLNPEYQTSRRDRRRVGQRGNVRPRYDCRRVKVCDRRPVDLVKPFVRTCRGVGPVKPNLNEILPVRKAAECVPKVRAEPDGIVKGLVLRSRPRYREGRCRPARKVRVRRPCQPRPVGVVRAAAVDAKKRVAQAN